MSKFVVPFFYQYKRYRELKSLGGHDELASVYIRSFLKSSFILLALMPVYIPLGAISWAMIKIGDAGDWIDRTPLPHGKSFNAFRLARNDLIKALASKETQ